MRVADLPLAWRTEFILHRFDGQVREVAPGHSEVRPMALGYLHVVRAHNLQRRAPQHRA